MRPQTITRRPGRYYAYIRSVEWKCRSYEYRKSVAFRCENCGWRKATQTHHLHYDNMGHELPEDLMALCRPCHEWMHRWPEPANDNQLRLPFDDINEASG